MSDAIRCPVCNSPDFSIPCAFPSERKVRCRNSETKFRYVELSANVLSLMFIAHLTAPCIPTDFVSATGDKYIVRCNEHLMALQKHLADYRERLDTVYGPDVVGDRVVQDLKQDRFQKLCRVPHALVSEEGLNAAKAACVTLIHLAPTLALMTIGEEVLSCITQYLDSFTVPND